MYPFQIIAKPIGPLCNLRCEYCFYLQKKKLFKHGNRSQYIMKDDVLEAYTRQYIAAQPEGTREINFSWQGGEPILLPQSFFEKALEYQRKYQRPGMRISNALQTNATLITADRAKWLADNNFLVGVSIDGDEELHNKYRRDRAGIGTFAQVMTGIEHLKSAGAEFNTLTVVQNDNAAYPERVYAFLTASGSRFLQFIPIVEPLSDSSVSSRTVSPKQWGNFMNGVFDNWITRGDMGSIFVQHFDLLLGLHAGYPASLCVHGVTCGQAPAIEHDGTIYSCDHFVTEKNQLGNVLEDELSECIFGKQQKIFGCSKRDKLPEECRTCRWLQLCNGGCLKDRLITGKGGKLNYLCEGYTALYTHTAPYFQTMVQCLHHRIPVSEFRRFFVVPKGSVGRNDPCPCMSGKKYKHCHGKVA